MTTRQQQLWFTSVELCRQRDALYFIPGRSEPSRDEIRLYFRLEALIRKIEARLP